MVLSILKGYSWSEKGVPVSNFSLKIRFCLGKHVQELKIFNDTSGFKELLPVSKGYFRFQIFQNFIKNSNLS